MRDGHGGKEGFPLHQQWALDFSSRGRSSASDGRRRGATSPASQVTKKGQVQPDRHRRREGKLSQSEIDRMAQEITNSTGNSSKTTARWVAVKTLKTENAKKRDHLEEFYHAELAKRRGTITRPGSGQ